MNKEIKLYGQIGFKVTAADFINTLSAFEQQGVKNLTIRLHSPGGDVIDGNAIFNAIQQSPIHIKIIIDGIAASMASIIILAANEVEICENAFIMVHRPVGGGVGNADDNLSHAKVLKDIEANFSRCYAAKTGLKPDEVKQKWLNGSDHWLNADEAIQYNFATRKVAAIAKDVLPLKTTASMNANSLYSRFAASLDINNNNNYNMKKELIEIFKLENCTPDSTDEEVLAALVEKFDNLEKQVNETTNENIEALLTSAVKSGKIFASQKETYRQVGKKSGVSTLTAVLENIRQTPSITSMLAANNKQADTKGTQKAKADWTLTDYRKYAPHELENDPKLYDALYRKEYNV